MRPARLPAIAAVVVLLTGLLAGCSAPTASPSEPSASPLGAGALQPVGKATVLASGFEAPWSILRLGDDDSTLISERDTGVVKELTPSGTLRTAGTVSAVVHTGEGGLLGLAIRADGDERWLYAYETTATDNRIVRMRLIGASGSYRFGASDTVLDGLEKAGNHDGGRIAFGPDAMLYATVGDASVPSRAQDPESLNGKILRMTATGKVPGDNPTAGSLVYSMGHRNPQGIAWDESGQLYAAEFGQDTWDEFNRIEPGGNYGWPTVEGKAGRDGFIDPLVQWPTDEASPSGLAYLGGTFFLAALKGERLWAIHTGGTTTASSFLTGSLGRLRDAVPGPDGTLWLLTNNTDGRGEVHSGDDKLVQLRLDVATAG